MKRMFFGLFILKLVILHVAGNVNIVEDLDEGWVDPFEMGHSSSSHSKPEPINDSKDQKSSSTNSEHDLRLLRIVKSFVRELRDSMKEEQLLSGSKIVWKTEMTLTSYEFQLLESFTDLSYSSTSLRDIEDALLAAFSSAKPLQDMHLPPKLPYISLPIYDPEDVMIVTLFGLLLCLGIAVFVGIVSCGKFFIGFIGLCTIWKWIHLRKSKQLDKDIPCEEEGNWFYEYLYSSCKKSAKDHLMNPTYEVAPTQALIDTLSEIFFRPLPIFGDHLGKFFNSLWGDNGFFSAMFGYGFVMFFTLISVPSIIISLFYFGVPKRRNTGSDRPKGDGVDNDKLRSLEDQVQKLTSTICTLREVHLQSMEYNMNRRMEEIKMSRDTPRNASLPIKHNPPILEDNPPYKKLKGQYHSPYEEAFSSSLNEELTKKEEDDNVTVDGSGARVEDKVAARVEGNEDKITTLSSNLILSPPTHFKNSKDEEATAKKEEKVKEEEVEDVDDDDDFEVISKSTPPPETEEEEIKEDHN